MSKKQPHPDIELFDFINGAVDERTAKVIEAHLSECDDCASVAALVRALKQPPSEPNPKTHYQISGPFAGDHPDIGQLASYFYELSQPAERAQVTSHVARCRSCAEAIAEYARAEHAAAEHRPGKQATGEVPAKAWEMIHDWEDSIFATLKSANEPPSQKLLERLLNLVSERAKETLELEGSQSGGPERVRVLVVNGTGEVRSAEIFEREFDSTGEQVLKHLEGSRRFDDKPIHLLLDYGEGEPLIVSSTVRRFTIRLPHETRLQGKPLRENYFIVEE